MRVFITGWGALSCLGQGPASIGRLFAGESGLALHAGLGLIGRAEAQPGPDETRLQALARQAAEAAVRGYTPPDMERAGIFISCSKGGMELFGPAAPDPGPWLSRYLSSAPGSRISRNLGWSGGGGNYPLACATGAYSIGQAFEAIREGRLDVALAGAAEASLTPLVAASFEALGALSPALSSAELRGAFDRGHQGFALGEGSAVLRLESESELQRSGAEPLAELLGWAFNSDAWHITAPEPEGRQASRCLQLALQKAGLKADQVGYLNAHGTGTRIGDEAELKALDKVFGARKPRVSSIKAATGHLLGASGALETLVTALALKRQEAPPSLGVPDPMPGAEAFLVRSRPQSLKMKHAASLSLGFGGHNVALVLGAA